MTVRLTESRLRQIIREELASLRESDHLADPLAGANMLAAAGEYRYSHYIDLEIYDTTGMLMKTPPHNEVTDDLAKLIDPRFDDLDLRIMAILTKQPRNEMEKARVRIYGSKMDLEEASELLPGETITPNPAFRAPRATQMRNPYDEPVNAPITSPLRRF